MTRLGKMAGERAQAWNGGALRRIRVERGLSAERLAAKVGCSGRTIFAWEKDTAPPERLVAMLARALRCKKKELTRAS